MGMSHSLPVLITWILNQYWRTFVISLFSLNQSYWNKSFRSFTYLCTLYIVYRKIWICIWKYQTFFLSFHQYLGQIAKSTMMVELQRWVATILLSFTDCRAIRESSSIFLGFCQFHIIILWYISSSWTEFSGQFRNNSHNRPLYNANHVT